MAGAPMPASPGAMSALAAGAWARWLYRVHRGLQVISGGRASLHVYLLCAQPVPRTAPATMRDDPNTHIALVAADDALVAAFPRPAEVLRQRFANGARCYAATVKQQFAGYIWLAQGHYDEDEVRCRYEMPAAPASVWDFDVYVDPRFRLSRVMSRLWLAVNQALVAQDVRWSFSRISLYNPASVQTHERLGARRVGVAAFLLLGPVQVTLQSGRPYVHAGISVRSVPTIRLRSPEASSFVPPCQNPS